jgi:lysophospholipase L1-like esterase
MKRQPIDSSLQAARKLRPLQSQQIRRRDQVNSLDRNDLFNFSLAEQKTLTLQLESRSQNTGLGMQLLVLKRSKAATLRTIGKRDFSDLSRKEIQKFFEPVITLRVNGRGKQRREFTVDSGEYYARVFHRRGKAAKYQLDLAAEAIPLPSQSIPSPVPKIASGPSATPVPANTPGNGGQTPINQAPQASDDLYNVVSGATLIVNAEAGVLKNDSDADGDGLTASFQGSTEKGGTIFMNSNGSFTYTSALGFAGNDRFTYSVKDSQGGVDTATVTINVAPGQAVRIMPVGDSITQGEYPRDSYRRSLWKQLEQAQYNIDFVGTKTKNYSLESGFSEVAPFNQDFDIDHDGRGGWRADAVSDNIGNWASEQQPDVVLLHIGTNDLLQSQPVESTVSDIGQIIDTLRIINPNIAILVAQINPPDWYDQPNFEQLNERIPVLAAAKHQLNSPVMVVDQTAGYDRKLDNYDGLHPNASGEQKLANQWFAALEDLFQGDTLFGKGKIHHMSGATGQDTFVLGNGGQRYYDDGNGASAGLSDYGIIKNFELGTDRIQLLGTANAYILGTSPINTVSGTAIYHDSNSNSGLDNADELLGIVQGGAGLNLANASQFTYV